MSDFDKLIESIENNGITELEIARGQIEPNQFARLGEALKHNLSIQEVQIEGDALNDITILPLLEGLETLPELTTIVFAYAALTDESMASLAELVAKKPELTTLAVNHTHITEDGVATLVKAASESGAIYDFEVTDNQYTPDAAATLLRAFKQYQPRNIVDFYHKLTEAAEGEAKADFTELAQMLDSKRDRIYETAFKLAASEVDEWSSRELTFVGTRLCSAKSGLAPDRTTQLLTKLDALPCPWSIDSAPPSILTAEQMLHTKEHGFCGMEAPNAWEEFDKVAEALETGGTTVNKAFLMENMNKDGEPIMVNGLSAGQLPAIQAQLAKHGESLTIEDLVSGTKASILLDAITEAGHSYMLLEESFRQNLGEGNLRQLFGALSEEALNAQPMRHQLMAHASRTESHATRIR